MPNQRLVFRVAAFTLVAASCLGSTGFAAKPDSSSEDPRPSNRQEASADQQPRGEIEQFLTEFLGAYMSGSVDSLKPFYTENALIWADKRQPIRGWTEIRAFLAGGFEKYEMSARAYLVDLRLLGSDAAFIQILTELKLTSREDGSITEKKFRDFALLARSGDSWRVAHDLDQPVSAEIFDKDLQAVGSSAKALDGKL